MLFDMHAVPSLILLDKSMCYMYSYSSKLTNRPYDSQIMPSASIKSGHWTGVTE